jgi:hypothetical protein
MLSSQHQYREIMQGYGVVRPTISRDEARISIGRAFLFLLFGQVVEQNFV